jgi:hypothetical protein
VPVEALKNGGGGGTLQGVAIDRIIIFFEGKGFFYFCQILGVHYSFAGSDNGNVNVVNLYPCSRLGQRCAVHVHCRTKT